MSRAGSQLASWLDLAALANMAAKPTEILVVNVSDVVCAVLADLAARAEASAASTTTRAAWPATGTTAAFSTTTLGTAEAARAGIPLVGLASLFSVL